MFELIFFIIVLIGTVMFYQLMAQAASAVIVISCRMDHGHFGNHWMHCDCKCHRMPQPDPQGTPGTQ
jgi:hypothetical protein